MAVVFQGIEGEKKGRMVIGCASVLRPGHGNTKTLLSFFPNNIGAKHFLRAKTLNSSNLTYIYIYVCLYAVSIYVCFLFFYVSLSMNIVFCVFRLYFAAVPWFDHPSFVIFLFKDRGCGAGVPR